MTWEVYEYHCEDCDTEIHLASPPQNPKWCPWCGVGL